MRIQMAETLEAELGARQREESAMGERLIYLRRQEGELRARLRDWHRESADLHDENNEAHAGDLVEIAETRPLSKSKRWRLLRVVEPAPHRGESAK